MLEKLGENCQVVEEPLKDKDGRNGREDLTDASIATSLGKEQVWTKDKR